MATYLKLELASGAKHTVRMTYLDRIAWEDYAVVRGLPVDERPVTASAFVAYAALKRIGRFTGEFPQFRQQLIDLEETTEPDTASTDDAPTAANPEITQTDAGDEIPPTRPAPGGVPL